MAKSSVKPSSRNAETGGRHGHPDLPSVTVESYNLEIRDEDGFIGDKASKGAFLDHLESLRSSLRRTGEDPLDIETAALGKAEMEALLREGNPREAGLILSAIEQFAQALAFVLRRFLRLRSWSAVERIVIGGGFRKSRIGELAIGRAAILLQSEGRALDLVPIRHHPDEAGLIGSAHLAPSWMFEAYDSLVAIDIGGSNIRAGIVALHQDKAPDLSRAKVWKSELWRHADLEPSREQMIGKLGAMLTTLIDKAGREDLRVAPFIGVGCPGLIEPDCAIGRGAQNLPGNWASKQFNLVERIQDLVPRIGEHDTTILMHNDAVVQGLSEMPFMQDVERWAVLTIGTGLGNASFRNKKPGRKKATRQS